GTPRPAVPGCGRRYCEMDTSASRTPLRSACLSQVRVPDVTWSLSEEVLEADSESRAGRDPADAEQHTGHERRPSQRVVPDRERLVVAAEQDLLVRDQASKPH